MDAVIEADKEGFAPEYEGFLTDDSHCVVGIAPLMTLVVSSEDVNKLVDVGMDEDTVYGDGVYGDGVYGDRVYGESVYGDGLYGEGV